MGDLALSYSALQKHKDALVMGKLVLEFRCRVLHKDHPDIGEIHVFRMFIGFILCSGTAMNNLALTYLDLEMHKEALRMQEEVLVFRKRVLPKKHPDISERRVFLEWLPTTCFLK
jgi:hypothetical protein